MTRRLILLRHGQTEYNATSRMQGQLDTELSDLGFQQAASAASVLVQKNITHVFSSDLSRAFNTASAVAALIDAEVRVDKRLRETHLGEWQAKTHPEVDSEYPGALNGATIRSGHHPAANRAWMLRAGHAKLSTS